MLDTFSSELRASPRLRWGLALIVAIGWLYGVLLLRDEVQDQTQRYRSAVQGIGRLQAQLAEPEWTARATGARALAVQLEGRLWQATTPGLAQAAYQDWLGAAMVRAGITNVQVTVTVVEDAPASGAITAVPTTAVSPEAGAATPADLWKIRAKLSFDFNPPAVMAFLALLENHEKQSVVKALALRKEPSPRAEMELVAYFQKQAQGTPAATTSSAKATGGL